MLAFASPLDAQTKGTGDIEGRVQNSVTGTAISHAQVSIAGTNRTTTTDEAGQYYLGSVPAGTVTIHVTAAGLDAQDSVVNVTPGGIATQDVGLTSKAMYGNNTVKLDAFVVQSSHETNAAAIAINEQRTDPNITSVVSTDEFGPRVDQNPGELLKMLPGVDVQYFANNIVGLSVRGLSSNSTEIQFDGMPLASMNAEGTSRGMEVQFASAADVSRVQIRKLPLPEDSANTIGGTINFTHRSAIEYNKLTVDYQGSFVSDGEHLTLQDMQGVKDRLTPRWKPNWLLKVTDPLIKGKFGFAVTAGQNVIDINTHWSLPSWNYGSIGTNKAIAAGGDVGTVPSQFNPAMTQLLNHDAPKEQGKDFASVRLDWRPTSSLATSWTFGGTRGWVQNADDIRYTWRMDATGSGLPTRYTDPHQDLGRAGGGQIYHNSPLWRDVYAPTDYSLWEAQWRQGNWEAGLRVAISESRYSYKDTGDGFFQSTSVDTPTGMVPVPQTGIGFNTANPIPLTVDFLNTNYWGAKTIQAWTTPAGAAGSIIPDSTIADYTVPIDWASNTNTKLGAARSRPSSGREILGAEKAYVTRYFNFDNPLSVKLGFDWSERSRKKEYDYYAWRFVGPNKSTDQISAVALQPRADFEYGDPGSQRISMTRYYKMYQNHPEWFQYDSALSEFESRSNSPKYNLWEKIPAGYAQFDWKLFHNKLHLAGGVRYERVEDEATGLRTDFSAAYMHYANGQVVRAGDLDAGGKAMVANLGSSTAVNYQLVNPATVLPTTSTGAPIFLPAIQQAGNVQYANAHMGGVAGALNTDPNYTYGFTNDTGTNLGRTSLPYYEAVYTPNGDRAKGMNDGFFPSINGSYSITPNLNFQLGYARTEARLDYSSVLIPGTSRDESMTGSGAQGTITMHNPDLKPWRANNFDTRLTWYNRSDSYIGIGAFTKRVQNTIVTNTIPNLTATDVAALNAAYPDLNLGPDAVGYDFKVSQNSSSSRLDGAEFEMRQNLNPYIGRWIQGLRLYATSTYTHPVGPQNNSVFNYIRWHDKVGLSYAHGRWGADVNWTHTGLQIDKTVSNSALLSPNGYQVELPQNLIDVSVTYALNRWLNIWGGVTDVTDERRVREVRYPGLSSYGTMTSSNTFGKSYFIGVAGRF